MSNGYDDLKQHTHVCKDWDYVCFTDSKELLHKRKVGVWKIKKTKCTKYDSKRNSGWHKTHPHVLFPKCETSIWIDGNVDILTDYLENIVKKNKKDMLVPLHYERTCIYDETIVVKETDHDVPEKCDETYAFLVAEKMPKKYGLNETNIMIRKHNKDKIKSIDELWWDCIQKYSKRDQLSFSYCLFKHGVKVEDIAFPNARIDHTNFKIIGHNYSKKAEPSLRKFIVRIICLFIFNQQKRRKFRRAHETKQKKS